MHIQVHVYMGDVIDIAAKGLTLVQNNVQRKKTTKARQQKDCQLANVALTTA